MQDLNKIIRSTIREPKEVFVSSLKETLDDRANLFYEIIEENIKKSIFKYNKKENKIKEEKQNKKTVCESVGNFMETLKESYFDNKTILHKFRDGNTVAITPEDSVCLVQMHDSLNIINQEKMRNLMSESFIEYNKILKFSKKHRKD